jgi:dTMP kinase
MTNKYFTFIGIDGSGKTSVISKIALALSYGYGFKTICVRQPHDEYRELIFGRPYEDPLERQLLFSAARCVTNREINRALSEDYVVLCDRDTDCTKAYGSADGVDPYKLSLLNEVTNGDGPYPARTYWLDVTLETSKERVAAHNRVESHDYDVAKDDFKQRVIASYEHSYEANPSRIFRVDANQSLGRVCEVVFEDVLKILNRKD